MSIHDMQMVMHHPDTSTILSRSLSESDLSEICGLGGATGSDPPSPIHMHMAPSDDDDTNTGTVVNFWILFELCIPIGLMLLFLWCLYLPTDFISLFVGDVPLLEINTVAVLYHTVQKAWLWINYLVCISVKQFLKKFLFNLYLLQQFTLDRFFSLWSFRASFL